MEQARLSGRSKKGVHSKESYIIRRIMGHCDEEAQSKFFLCLFIKTQKEWYSTQV
jgi:hypothetical protein